MPCHAPMCWRLETVGQLGFGACCAVHFVHLLRFCSLIIFLHSKRRHDRSILGGDASTAQGGGGSFKDRSTIGKVELLECWWRSDRWLECRCLAATFCWYSWWFHVFIHFYFYLSIRLSGCLSACPSMLSIYRSIYLSVYLPVYWSNYPCIYLLFLSICLSFCLSIYLSVYWDYCLYLSICLTIHLSI